jgi:hypothetical protein
MGLDITAHKGLKKVNIDKALLEDEDFEPEDGNFSFYINPNYAHIAKNINTNLIYEADKTIGFRAGSYGGYNVWREQLAKLAGYPAKEDYDGHQKHSATVWHNPVAGDFLEIINFSDCEGIIGSEISQKLAKDFEKYQNSANELGDERFLDLYNTWREAFELASDNGCVEFH